MTRLATATVLAASLLLTGCSALGGLIGNNPAVGAACDSVQLVAALCEGGLGESGLIERCAVLEVIDPKGVARLIPMAGVEFETMKDGKMKIHPDSGRAVVVTAAALSAARCR